MQIFQSQKRKPRILGSSDPGCCGREKVNLYYFTARLVTSTIQRTPSRLLTAAQSGPTRVQQELLVYWEATPQAKTQPIYLLLALNAQ